VGSFIYTATQELVGARSVGDLVVLDIGVQEAVRSRNVEKNVQRSQGGAMEVLWNRADVNWEVTLEPVSGYQLEVVREFMASTESGEAFSMDLYGTSSVPKVVKRIDSGYTEQPFMRAGSESRDWFVVTFQVVEL